MYSIIRGRIIGAYLPTTRVLTDVAYAVVSKKNQLTDKIIESSLHLFKMLFAILRITYINFSLESEQYKNNGHQKQNM